MTDLTKVKLGRLRSPFDRRALWLNDYTQPTLPPEPVACDYSKAVTDWGMMLNDSLGDCAIAAPGHMEMGWTANAGNLYVPTDADILTAYEAVGGYSPTDPNTDQGCNMLDVLKYWKATGIAGHTIGAYVRLNPQRIDQIKQAVAMFGSVYLGVNLPIAAQNQPVWDLPDGQELTGDWSPGSWGGHAIMCPEYDAATLSVVTWGEIQGVTWPWIVSYCDEAYAVLSPDLFNGQGKAPDGLDMGALQSDLQSVITL